ncbi:MAG: MFS transporter [Calditrichia bacterium]
MFEGFSTATRALRYRNFRLFFAGQSISLIGTWMQRIALGWLVYRLTNSAFLLGIVGFAGQLPTFIFTPFAGVLADRLNRHRLIILTQSIAMLQALLLAALVFSGVIVIWHVITLSILLGIINAMDMPVRQSFTVEMVEGRENLGNAIALNSSMVNAARLVGPSLAGVIIAATGEGFCFLINGLSYIAVIAALLMMKLPRQRVGSGNKKNPLQQLKEGYVYAYSFAPIRAILLLLSIVSLVGMPYTVLMPVFAKTILQGDASTLGILMGAAGLGALAGAGYLASRRTVLGLGSWMAFTTVVFALGLIAFSFSRYFYLSLLFMLFTGFGMISLMAASNTILQTIVDDDKRGRVMSFYTVSIMGMLPFGSLLTGALAGKFGAPATFAVGGLICLLSAGFFYYRLPALRVLVRPIYARMGIIPEIAAGLQSASEISTHDKNT